MMRKKLTELNPCWVGHGGEGISDAQGNAVPRRESIGISFDCPCGCGTSCFIPFANPLDGGAPVHNEAHLWQRTGDAFENLTLTPSIQRIGGCAWHGFITNGEAHT